MTGLRDFLLLFFFIDLGARLDFSTLGGEIVPAALLSLFVLIGSPLIVMTIVGAVRDAAHGRALETAGVTQILKPPTTPHSAWPRKYTRI